jgi:hypothetical protein
VENSFWSNICKLSAKRQVETEMAEKKLAPRRAGPKPGRAKALSKAAKTPVTKMPAQHDAHHLSEHIIEHLTDMPARLATSTLSELLRNTTDQTTRIAILAARIEVLRARVICCRMGQNADANASLGTLRRQLPTEKLPGQIDAPELPTPGTKNTTGKMVTKDDEKTFRIKLLKTHVNEGIELTKGAIFTVSTTAGQSLIDRQIAQLAPEVATDDENNNATQATMEVETGTSATT